MLFYFRHNHAQLLLMDSIIELVGPFGIYQKFVSVALGFISALSSMTVFSTVFILANPPLICYNRENDTTTTLHADTCKIWNIINENNRLNQSCVYECRFDNTYYENTVKYARFFCCCCKRKSLTN